MAMDPDTAKVIASALVIFTVALVPLGLFVFIMLPFWRRKPDAPGSGAEVAGDSGAAGASTVEGATLTFRDVEYSVPKGEGEKLRILKGVSGVLRKGTLTAIMGPSGCGKSTLLDVLADCKSTGFVSGDIRLNGESRPSNYRSAAAYVMQSDNTHATLTVRETLTFASELRLPYAMGRAERLARVHETMADTDLLHVADTRIGDDVSGGLSGGQRRRDRLVNSE